MTKEHIHTCHAECPCQSGGKPCSDFIGPPPKCFTPVSSSDLPHIFGPGTEEARVYDLLVDAYRAREVELGKYQDTIIDLRQGIARLIELFDENLNRSPRGINEWSAGWRKGTEQCRNDIQALLDKELQTEQPYDRSLMEKVCPVPDFPGIEKVDQDCPDCAGQGGWTTIGDTFIADCPTCNGTGKEEA